MLFDKQHVFNNFTDIAAWVEENVCPDLPGLDAEQQTIWFCAWHKANDMREEHDMEDWAYEIQNGIKPMNTRSLCNEWIKFQVPDEDDLKLGCWAGWSTTELQEFWGK